MTILITLTTIGTDCSLFDIYSNTDGFVSAFETDVPKASLSAGFSSANVPDGTTIIRVKAKGVCTNYKDINLSNVTTTTTTSSSSTTTTTTTTEIVEPCYTWKVTTLTNGSATYINCLGQEETSSVGGTSGINSNTFCAMTLDSSQITLSGDATLDYIGVCLL